MGRAKTGVRQPVSIPGPMVADAWGGEVDETMRRRTTEVEIRSGMVGLRIYGRRPYNRGPKTTTRR